MHRRTPTAAAVLLAAVAAACLKPTTPPAEPGEPVDAGARIAPVGAHAVAVDFGDVAVGDRAERTVAVRNDGPTTVQVLEVRRGATFDDSFRIELQPFTLPPGAEQSFTVTFEPSERGARLADFLFSFSGRDTPELVVHAKGTGVAAGCVAEAEVAIGTVVVGESIQRGVRIANSSDLSWTVTVGALEGGGEFALSPGFSPGHHIVPAYGSLDIPVVFSPRAPGPATAHLPIAAPPECGVTGVALTGAAVSSALAVKPQPVNFGYRNVGDTVRQIVRIRNETLRPRTVTRLAITGSAGDAFRLETLERTRVIAGEEVWEVPLIFKPEAIGEQHGTLSIATDAPGQGSMTIALSGIGGGPDVAAPSAVEFGEVATGGVSIRTLQIANRGTDVPGTSDDDLIFGAFDASGQWQPRAPEINSATGEFSLEYPGVRPYLTAGETTRFRIKFAPKSSGPQHATLTVFTNDPDQPTLEIPVDGVAVSMPPCDLVVRPLPNFGTVPPNTSLTLPVQLDNIGATECLVSGVELEPGTSPAFKLVGGPVASTRVAPGESIAAPIEFAAPAPGSHGGALNVFSSAAPPRLTFAISGTSAASCLALTPVPLDFGPIPVGCASVERTVKLKNTCATTTSVDSIDLLGLSPEISISQKPALPTTLTGLSSVPIKLRYRPAAAGLDREMLAVQAGLERRLLPISGTGVALATRTDEFVQTQFTATDLLLVFDNTPSMGDKSARLSSAIGALFQAARTSPSDFHIATTATGVDPTPGSTAANGRLLPLAGPVKVWTRANIDQFWSQSGISAPSSSNMLIRPAYLALSPPLVTGENAGFLRPYANLAVLIISDADDPDATPLTSYESFFASLKRGPSATVSGIVPTFATAPTGCSYDHQAGDRTRVANLVTATGGVLHDICSADWLPAIDRIARFAFPTEFRFPLASAPDVGVRPEPVQVSVDGQPLPKQDANGTLQWWFDAATNDLVFRADIAPPPFSRISASYQVACLP